jgi:mannose-6-phosphate isomerase
MPPAPASVAAPHPLLLTPILLEKVWGGDRLARFGKRVAAGAKVGESWELADLATTSASGAGGGAAISTIFSGPLAGKTLHDAVRLWGRDLLGDASPPAPDTRHPIPDTCPPRPPRFPLLIKFLDARENLSVQVHPSINYAKAHPDVSIKTECWYILDADPGAVIYKGVKPGVTRESFEKHLRRGDGSGVLEDLEAVPARVGDMHNLPSGTVHALGAGVLVAEVQTPSDTTFRVYDWGRQGRQLHIEQALECIHFGPARDATRLPPGERSCRLVSTGYFTVDEVVLGSAPTPLAEPGPKRPVALMVIDGSCTVRSMTNGYEPVAAPLGCTVLVPACLASSTEVVGSGRVLRVGVLSGPS